MSKKSRLSRSGFSLVEMLVVIAILGILASLILPAVWRAVVRARETRIILEVTQLDMAIESYRQRFGDYPPDFTDPDLVRRHLRRAFPRHSDDDALDELLHPDNRPTPAEALVFWLSQLRNNPRRPLSGSGDPIVLFDFDQSEMRTAPTRAVPIGTDPPPLQLYQYIAQDGNQTPYVYFDSRTYCIANYLHEGPGGSEVVRPYAFLPPAPPGSEVNRNNLDWARSTTFQIISAGLDGEFGNWGNGEPPPEYTYKVFPTSFAQQDVPLNEIKLTVRDNAQTQINFVQYADGDFDNIANFTDGRTFVDSLE